METINNKLFTNTDCKFRFLSKEGFNTPKFYDLQTFDDFLEIVKTKSKEDGEFSIKGIVQELNAFTEDEGNPSIYFDFKNMFKTTLLSVDWVLNSNGVLNPVATFNNIIINQKNYGKSSLKNTSYLERLIVKEKMKIGSEIIVLLKDKNIPHILMVTDPKDGAEIPIPSICTACDTPFDYLDGKIFCNNIRCKSKTLNVLENYVKLLNDTNITLPFIKTLIDKFDVATIDDIKQIPKNELSEEIYDKFQQLHNVSKSKFLNLLQPKNNGERVMGHIIDSTDLDILLNKDTVPNDIFDISIVDEESRLELEQSIQLQLNTIIENAKHFNIDGNTSNIDGKIFCFTNTMKNKSMKEYELMVVENGGIIGNVTQKLDYLISNESKKKSGKYNKVVSTNTKLYNDGKTHSINILTEDKLIKLMEN